MKARIVRVSRTWLAMKRVQLVLSEFRCVLEFLDAVLHVTPGSVHILINRLWCLFEVGAEIPGVIPLVPAGVAGDFSFDDYPPALTPGLSLVLVFSVMPFTVAAGGAGSPRLFHQVFSEAAQDAVAGHASHVIHLLFFEVIEHGGAGETTVKANHNPGFGKSSTQPRQGSFQDADRSSSGACVAGPEHAGENKLLTLIVELQETQHWQVAVTAVEAVEQAALLRSVGSINRGVKINGDVLDLLTAEAFPVP